MEEKSSALKSPLNGPAVIAFASGILALAALVIVFWLRLPSILLGLLAVVLGVIGRSRALKSGGGRDIAVAAIVLGIVATLATPWINAIVE